MKYNKIITKKRYDDHQAWLDDRSKGKRLILSEPVIDSLRDMDFSGMVLDEAVFYHVNLTGAKFIGCQLWNADFNTTNLTNTKFNGANLSYADFNNSIDYPKTEFNGADFSGAIICNTHGIYDYLTYEHKTLVIQQ